MLEVGQEWILHISPFRLKETTTPTNAQVPSNVIAFYAKDDGSGASQLCYKNDAGTETCLPNASIVSGTGVVNRLAYWTAATTIDDVPRTFTAGSVLFAHTDFLPQEDNTNFFWDDTNNRLGLGINVPTVRLDVRGDARIQGTGTEVVLDVRGASNNLLNISETGTTALYKFGATGSTNAFLSCADNFIVQIDSDANSSSDVFLVKHDAVSTGGTTLFEVSETGVTTATTVLNATVGYRIAGAAASGNILRGDGTNFVSSAQSGIDHGSLGGLGDDDHTQYALLLGRSGGQVLIGGTGNGDDLTLRSTSDATKGDIFMADAGGNIIIGGGATASRLRLLEASGSGTNYTEFVTQPQAGNITYVLPADDGDAGEQLQTDGSGNLSWEAPGGTSNALLDGSVHSDTTASTVTRGDLIYGNSTPAWDDLAVGGSAGMFLRTDATDVMWSTLILPNAITANNIVYGSATNTYGQSTNLTFDGTDFLLGSGIRARMVGQNRFRHLNSAAEVYKTSNQTGLTINTWNTATFQAEEFDTDGLHDNASNTSRLTAAIDGKYLVTGSLYIDETNIVTPANAGVRIIKNGSTAIVYGDNVSATITGGLIDPTLVCTGFLSLVAGDYIELQGLGSGGSGTFDIADAAGLRLSRFGMFYVGE